MTKRNLCGVKWAGRCNFIGPHICGKKPGHREPGTALGGKVTWDFVHVCKRCGEATVN